MLYLADTLINSAYLSMTWRNITW